MIKDIVVNLGLGAKDPAGDYAVALGEALEAHVAGVAFSYEPVIPGAVMGGIPPEFIEAQRTEADKKAKAAVARFEAAAKRSGLSAESRIISASVSGAADQFARIGRRFDLVIVGQADPAEGFQDEVVDETALFESGRPVVYVPFIQKGGVKFDRIMVCWDGGRAATRAIADSLPLLKKAKQVEIVIIASKAAKGDEIAGADLGQHLARHGLKVDVKRITSPDIDVASTILSYAADSSTDMIVMGGYGHSRLREFVLGGATRGILESMTVPVLMSH
ncbi:universal stress protein [Undibacter mobilis]|uniref:Universal stress protein n=1 Tax=Undibacter mobilis TaxID=2292256 RepID=A0A371BBU2_9BRAD|nr:universal stress protein [Undibacter mobilis]RDV04883.1 universal stress protein [Undibacter mobilis]